MTTFVVMAKPPIEGHLLQGLVPEVLEPPQAVELYRAMLADVCEVVQTGGPDLLVNYRPADTLGVDGDPEQLLRELLTEELPEPGEVRYEPQVGETVAGRIGNSLTHLLETEEVDTVGVTDPAAIFLRRDLVGSAMMKLRGNEVVLGPAPDGRVYFAGFDDPIDFEDAYAPPAIETLTDRGMAAELAVDFMPMTPVFETPEDLETVVPLLRARLRAGLRVPPRTTARMEALGLIETADIPVE